MSRALSFKSPCASFDQKQGIIQSFAVHGQGVGILSRVRKSRGKSKISLVDASLDIIEHVARSREWHSPMLRHKNIECGALRFEEYAMFDSETLMISGFSMLSEFWVSCNSGVNLIIHFRIHNLTSNNKDKDSQFQICDTLLRF